MKTKYTLLALAAFFSLSLSSCDALLPKTNRSKQDNNVEQSQTALSSGQSKESNKTSSVHVHTFSNYWVYDDNEHWKESTCEHKGLKSETAQHRFDIEVERRDATFETNGYVISQCSVCGCQRQVDIAKKTHSYSSVYSYDDNSHWKQCLDEGYQNLRSEEEPHDLKLIASSAATYDASGYEVYSCRKCEYVKTVETPILVHNYSNDWSHDENNHWRVCLDNGYENLNEDFGAHQLVVVESQSATYEQQGYTVYQCSVCGYSRTENINQLEHKFNNTWSWDDTGHWHACRDAGYENLRADYGDHTYEVYSYTPATFDSPSITVYACSVCSHQKTVTGDDQSSHTYSSEWTYDEYYHWHACTDEGYDLVNDKNEHDYVLIEHVEATFEHGGYDTYECMTCHYVSTQNVVPQLEHNYSSDWSYSTTYHWRVCTDEGYDDLLSEHGSHNLRWEYSGNNKYQTAYCMTCGAELSKDFETYYLGGPEYDENGLMYFLMDDETYAVGAAPSFSQTDLVVPSSYNGKLVTRIMAYGFNRTNICSVSLPNTIASIGYCSFSSCYNIDNLLIPRSVRTIGASAFSFDNFDSVTIEEGVVTIMDNAFSYCGRLQSIYIPESVEEVSLSAFRNCSSLQMYEVGFGNNRYSSSNGALYDKDETTLLLCPQAISGVFNIPNSLEIIDDEAFVDCLGITAFEVVANKHFSSENGILYNKTKTKLIRCPAAKTGDVIVPSSVVEYYPSAFKNCWYITSLDLPYGLTEIWSNAFYSCTSLASISIPESVITIRGGAFSCCESLTFVDLPNSVKRIEDNAFYSCGLTSLNLTESIEHVGGLAFQGSFNIESVNCDDNNPYYHSEDGVLYNADMTRLVYYPAAKNGAYEMPAGVVEMSSYAFYAARSVTSISFPLTFSGLIAAGTFVNCSSLESFSVDIENNNYSSLEGVLYNKDKTSLIAVPAKFSGSFTVPEGVTTIYTEAFAVTNLNLIVLPSTLTYLNNHMFYANYNLTDVVILSNNVVIRDGEVPADSCYNLSHIYLALSSTDDMSYYRTIVAAFGGNVDVYLYSEDNPHSPNMYWHYVDGVPTIWP